MIFDLGNSLIAARSGEELEAEIERADLKPEESYPVIDAKAERWTFLVEYMVVSPLCFKKRPTKKEIIEMFNTSNTARKAGMEYPMRSLSSKRLDRVIAEVAEAIRIANKRIRQAE